MNNYSFRIAAKTLASLVALCAIAVPTIARAQDTDTAAPTPAAQSPATADQSTPPTAAATQGTDQPGAPVTAPSTMTGQSTTTASPPPASHFVFGPEVGAFFPSGKLSKRFGSSWVSVGLGLGSISVAPRTGEWGLDLNLLSRQGTNTHAYIAPIGVQYRVGLSSSGSVVPYIGASADLVLSDIRSPQDHAHSGLMETGGASVFIGTNLGPQAYIEARYLALGSVQGFDLSGADLTFGLRF